MKSRSNSNSARVKRAGKKNNTTTSNNSTTHSSSIHANVLSNALSVPNVHTSLRHNSPLLTIQRGYKSKGRGSKMGRDQLPPHLTKKVAKDPNQIQLGLSRRAETALQMVHDSTPTTSKSKSVHRITHIEKNVKQKITQLEVYLSHSPTSYSLGEILSIYNTFKEIRFAAPLSLWTRMMGFWNTVGQQKALDETNRKRALQIPLELMDELMAINKLGVFTVMKQKHINLPEHLLQFNLRPNTSTFSKAVQAMHRIGNHQGALSLFDQHNAMLEEIPDVQYLPSPLLPEGPEKEQEFVSRRLMAKRREELQNNASFDKTAMFAASSLHDDERVEQLMSTFLLDRAYLPAKSTLRNYQSKLVRNNQPIAQILLFKEYFQAPIRQKNLTNDDFIAMQDTILDKLTSDGAVRFTEEPIQANNDDNSENGEVSTDLATTAPSTTRTFFLPLTRAKMNTNLPPFLGHNNMQRSTTNPSNANWVELFRSLAQLHPKLPTETSTTTTTTTTTTTPNTTTTALVSTKPDNNHSQISRFAALGDMKVLVKNKALRKHLYKVAREEHGITIDKSFFLPMITEATSYDQVLAFLGDFHDEVEEFRQQSKKNPWTEDELAAQEKEKQLKSMLVVDLNVTPHDQRMRQLFGRYVDNVKSLGYDNDMYTAVHERLVHFLVDTYQRDTLENDIDGNEIDVSDLYDIETIVDVNGNLQKIKKPKVGPDGDILSTRHINGRRKTLFELFKESKKANDDDGEEGDVDSDGVKKSKTKVRTGNQDDDNTTSQSSQNNADDVTKNQLAGLPPPLQQTPLTKVIDRFNQETTQMLLSSTTRKRVKHILSSIQTVRAYQEAYGLPVASKTETHYLEALVLMSRRNEVYPPVLSTSDTSLIKYQVAPYIPSFDGESTSSDIQPFTTGALLQDPNANTTKPLVTFKDRIHHIHNSLLRREAQLRLTMQEIEHSIDSLATMKNELDSYGKLQQINLKVLNDAIEALSELSVDAALLRGPFDATNIFHYSASSAHNALTKLGNGEDYPGMKIDPKTGAKFVPGLTEPHPYQIDRVDLEEFIDTSARISQFAFGEMKSSLQHLTQLSTGLSPQQVQHISLLQPNEFGSMITEKTYLPLLKAAAAHGDYSNVLLLVESAHQHRDVIPTTNMLNHVAVAFMNSARARHAAGVLDIMQTASNPENRKMRKISEDELSHAIKHGTAEALLEVVQSQLDVKVLPNSETISLLLRMYKSQGMLDHVEELWRRLTYHDPASWTSFSAVEEQKMVAQVLAAELDASISSNHPLFEKLHGAHRGTLDEMPNLSMAIEDAYDRALNPVQNKSLKQALKHDEVRKNMSALLHNRSIDSLLPQGAHRTDIPQSYVFGELRLDSASTTVMIQTFIQLGHPMHALQIYLDMRQSMPIFPITPPKLSKSFKKAREINRFLTLTNDNPEHDATIDSLTDFMIKTQGQKAVDDAIGDTSGSLAVPTTPSKRSLVSDKQLMVTATTNGSIQTDPSGVKIEQETSFNLNALSPRMVQINHVNAQTTQRTVTPSDNALVNSNTYEQLMSGTSKSKQATPFDQIRNGLWPEADMIASLALYAYKKGEQYLKKMTSDGKAVANIPPEVLAHAKILLDASQSVLSSLKRYSVDTPYLPGDDTTLLYYSNPGTLGNVVSPNSGAELTQPRLLLPFTTDTVHIYRQIDALIYSDIALEETVFKMRYQSVKPIGMQRWFTIFPTMINQCKAINQSEEARVEISDKLDALRDDVEMLLATGRRKPKYVRIAEIIEEKRQTGDPLTAEETLLIESQSKDRTDSSQSNTLQIGGLYNQKTHVADRGISHPKTHAFTNATLPATPEFDISEFTKKDDATKAWVSNFKTFFNSKASTSEFLSKIQAAPVLDKAKQDELKKKLLSQTKAVQPKLPDQDTSSPTDISPQPEQDPPSPPSAIKPKFDRWSPTDSTSSLPNAPAVKDNNTDDAFPIFPFMKESEKKTDGKKLIQQIKRELHEAQNGFGLYGSDGKIKTDFVIEDDSVELAAENSFQQAVKDLQTFNLIEKKQGGQLNPAVNKNNVSQQSKPNALLLPEVQKMKKHLANQASVQRAIIDQYNKDPSTASPAVNGVSTYGGYDNKLQQMLTSDLTLLKSFQEGQNVTDLDTQSQSTQWLTPPTDLAVATQVTERYVKVKKDKFQPLPGIIDPDYHKLSQRSELMKKITGEQIEAKPVTKQRPGGIHTSPHGPQSYRPENQFRSPSSMAKLANTPDTEVDPSKLAVNNDEKNIKFTVATHGVGISDRPGRPTKISQEYLEQYLMGIGPDPKDRRNQARHKAATDEYDISPLDPSFIQKGDPGAKITNRGGGVGADGVKAGSHQEGYGVGVHKFRERSKAKLTEMAQQGAHRLLEEFESQTFVASNNPFEADNLERDFDKIPKKERQALEYKNIFELGGEDDDLGSQAMSRTGKYSMLSQEDRTSRDKALAAEGFADLEAQMNALFSKGEAQHTAIESSLGDTTSFKNKTTEQSKKIKEVFSSAMLHTNKKDYFGVANKRGTSKNNNQSTMFD